MSTEKGLRELAEAAEKVSPGPWSAIEDDDYVDHWAVLDAAAFGICGAADSIDAKYIAAAGPDVILALLDRLEAAERERDEAQARVTELEANVREMRRDRVESDWDAADLARAPLLRAHDELVGKLRASIEHRRSLVELAGQGGNYTSEAIHQAVLTELEALLPKS